jgi:hypothetical protein
MPKYMSVSARMKLSAVTGTLVDMRSAYDERPSKAGAVVRLGRMGERPLARSSAIGRIDPFRLDLSFIAPRRL